MQDNQNTENAEEQELSLAEQSAKNAMLEFLRLSEAMGFQIGEVLKALNLKLSVAESCTAGLLGTALTQMGGASAWFEGGIISYSNEVKQKQLNVSKIALENHGAVSALTVCQMALGATKAINTNIALSISGIAGPSGGSEEKPVGTVWIGLCLPNDLPKLQKKHQKKINKLHEAFFTEHKTVLSSLKLLKTAFYAQASPKLSHGDFNVQALEFLFTTDRNSVRQSAVLMALYFLYQELINIA